MGSVYDELVTKVAINRYRLTRILAAIFFFCFILFLEYVGLPHIDYIVISLSKNLILIAKQSNWTSSLRTITFVNFGTLLVIL